MVLALFSEMRSMAKLQYSIRHGRLIARIHHSTECVSVGGPARVREGRNVPEIGTAIHGPGRRLIVTEALLSNHFGFTGGFYVLVQLYKLKIQLAHVAFKTVLRASTLAL